MFELPTQIARNVTEALTTMAFGGDPTTQPALATTARDTLLRDGTAQLYRFRRPEGAPPAPKRPVLLIPSMIGTWYVLDLRSGSSFAEGLVRAGHDVWCLDWGVARPEDRYFTWADAIDRIARMVRFIRRETGADRVGVLGYCMGATLSAVYTALYPDQVAALVDLLGPIDFSEGGILAHMVNPKWFDVDAISDAGNLAPTQMQSGFTAMRPTLNAAKLVGYIDRMGKPGAHESFMALETWGGDNVPFPAEAYRTYIREIYQQNLLPKGEHRVRGRRVDLKAITCPVLTIAADRDTICPLPAARALNERCGSDDVTLLTVPGGHVGAVVGSKAAKELYPATAQWLRERLDR